mmetsp:Transcript_21230/g.59076  ORF Transcript_21230/g.59076 Transcript_21230/m.59076 type:complete len:372 (-) Transcript_21230:1819-2934(-)
MQFLFYEIAGSHFLCFLQCDAIQCIQNTLVHLDMPLLLGLEALEPVRVLESLLLGDSLEHVLDSWHHSLQSAEVDVGTVLELLEDLIGVLLDLVLDVHLSARLVGLLAGEGVVDAEVVWELLLGGLELVIVKEGVAVGDSEEQPGLTLVGLGGWGVLREQTADESTVWGNSGSGGDHDVVGGWVLLWHKHDLSGWAGHLHLVTWLGVAQEVGADALLGWIVGLELWAPVGGATDAQGSGLSGHVITVTGRRDGVETDGVWLSILLAGARWDHTPRLSLPVWEVTLVVDDDVASLSGGLWSDNALGGDDLSGEWGLVLVNIHWDGGLVIVWLSLEEVLGGDAGAESWLGSWSEGVGGGQAGGDAECGLHLVV